MYLVVVPIGIGWFYFKGDYTRRRPFWDEMRSICQVLPALAIIEGALIYLTKSTSFSRIWFAASFSFLLFVLPLLRYYVKTLLRRLGKWQLPTVIIGAGENAFGVMEALQSDKYMGFDIRLFLSLDESEITDYQGVTVMKIPTDIKATLRKHKASCVILALDEDTGMTRKNLLEKLHSYTQDLYLVPSMRGVPLYGMEIHHFFRHEVIMMRINNNLLRPIVRIYKRGFDIVCSITLLCLLSPLLLLLGVLVCLDGGPPFFAHTRIGYRGEPFKCLKFRSMVKNAPQILQDVLSKDPTLAREWQKNYKLKKDPRVTRIGAFLRHTSLDELPQLINVLRGEMSLVGPRPLVDDEIEKYGNKKDYYLKVRPGITGLWQVSGRNNIDYNHRIYLDVWYVKNWSLWHDIVILFKTCKVVLNKHGAY